MSVQELPGALGEATGLVVTGRAVATPRAEVPSRATAELRSRWVTLAIGVADVLAVLAGYAIAAAATDDAPSISAAGLYATALVWPAVLGVRGLYDRRRMLSPAREARQLFEGSATSAVIVVLLAFFFLNGDSRPRAWTLAVWWACTATLAFERFAARRVLHALHRRNVLATRTVIVGVNGEARSIARVFTRQRWLGYRVVGFVEVAPCGFEHVDGHPVVGTIDAVVDAVREADAALVVVAGTAVNPEILQDLSVALRGVDVDVRFSPGLPHVAASRMAIEPVDGIALLSVERKEFTGLQSFTKRLVDVVVAGSLLLVTLPALAAVALAVRLTSAGPILFKQVRAGLDGRPFVMLKFRTMVADAELRLDDLADANESDGLLFKIKEDPRVTPIGRFLRQSALDELPQLINVLKGDMSIVGPRPALPNETQRYDEQLRNRLAVKPGLTGLWQVNGRSDLPFEDYVRYDLFYVENWSLALDLYVLIRTIPALLSRRGAY